MATDPLKDFVDRALTELPTRRAPATLIDRVNTALLASRAMRDALPWYARGWTVWPAAARMLVVTAGVAAVAAFVWLGFAGSDLFSVAPVRELAAERAPYASGLLSAFVAVLEGLRLAVESLAQPYLIGVLVVVGAAYATCVGAGAGLYRFLQARHE